MFRIKRTKYLPPQPMDAITGRQPPAIHYAQRVDVNGCVSLWTADVDQAAAVDAATVARVEAHYASRPNAGQLSFEPLQPEPAESPVLEQPPEPMVEEPTQELPPEPAEEPTQEESSEPAVEEPQEKHPEQTGRKSRRHRTEE